jgi:hypothetical protein
MPTSRLLAIHVSLLLISLLTAPVAASAQERIPFSETGGLIAIHASLDGKPPVPMLIDLGAGVNVLSADAAKRLKFVPNGRYTNWRMSGERVDVPTGTIGSIALGPLTVNNPTVTAWNGLDGSGFDGLLSASVFRNTPVTFDYVNHLLIIEDPASFAQRKLVSTRIPIELQDDRDITLGIFARFDFGNGQSGLCEIDTGSQGYFLDRSYATKLGIHLDDPALKHVHTSSIDATVAPIASMMLQGAPETAIASPKGLFANLIFDCNIGNEFWANKIFTLDIPGRSLWVSPAETH